MRTFGRTVVVGVALAGAAWASGVAHAHDHSIAATCEGVVVSMTNYSTEPDNTNTVAIEIDGSSKVATTFGATYSWSWTFDDQTTAHTYRVAVTATKYPEATFDTGVVTIPACAEATTTSSTTTTTSSTTTTLASLAPETTTTLPATTTSTSAAPATSTTLLAAATPASTTTLVAAAPPQTRDLPATGADDDALRALATAGAVAVLAGAALLATAAATRRR